MLGSLKRFWVPFLVLPWGVECSAESQVSSQSEVRVRSDRSGESDKDHSQANFISGVPGRVCIAERWVGNSDQTCWTTWLLRMNAISSDCSRSMKTQSSPHAIEAQRQQVLRAHLNRWFSGTVC